MQRSKEDGRPEVILKRTTKTDTPHERQNARPDAENVGDPKEVWKSSEVTPQGRVPDRIVPPGRVADAGDISDGEPSPYGAEVQADVVGKQTKRSEKVER